MRYERIKGHLTVIRSEVRKMMMEMVVDAIQDCRRSDFLNDLMDCGRSDFLRDLKECLGRAPEAKEQATKEPEPRVKKVDIM